MMTRLGNVGMLLFKPVALDARLLGEIALVGAGSDVDFCIVNDPFTSLNRGSQVKHAQLAMLMNNPDEHQPVSKSGNGYHASGLNRPPHSEWWN